MTTSTTKAKVTELGNGIYVDTETDELFITPARLAKLCKVNLSVLRSWQHATRLNTIHRVCRTAEGDLISVQIYTETIFATAIGKFRLPLLVEASVKGGVQALLKTLVFLPQSKY